ncbi:MAG: hypothetical protein JW800_07890 [Candidatus Omnitrophica bacterium]|nr:hypothetical protein [Candidatus Omnitrophota bacterium]
MKKRILTSFILGVFFALFFLRHSAATGEELPRNVSIEVEFKEKGNKKVGLGPLGRYEIGGSSQYTKQFLVVSDGLTGSIRVGQDIPYVDFYRRYLYKHGYTESAEISFRQVGTELAVSPKIRGDYIEVYLTPKISYVSKGARNVINIKELTTTVLMGNGQSMSISGLIEDEEFSSYFLKTKSASNLDIILTVRIQ